MKKAGLTAGLFLLVTFITVGWGFYGHKVINQLAIYALPKALQGFYYRHQQYLVENSIRPSCVGKRRWLFIGFLLGLTSATRLSAGLNIILFAAAALMTESPLRKKASVALAMGFALPMTLLALYNFARFDSFVETGYGFQLPGPGDFPSTSVVNVLPHLRLFLFGAPVLSDQFPFFITQLVGMSVFLLSPWLCYLGSLKLDRVYFAALVNCLVVLVAVLAWRSTGQFQLGYRFSLDLLPVVIFLIARNGFHGGPLPARFKLLTVLGFVFTLYFFWSFIAIVPHR